MSDVLYYRTHDTSAADFREGKINLYDTPPSGFICVPIKKHGYTFYAVCGDPSDSRASPVSCDVDGVEKRLLHGAVPTGNTGTFSLGDSYSSRKPASVTTKSFTVPEFCNVVKITGSVTSRNYTSNGDRERDYGFVGKSSDYNSAWVQGGYSGAELVTLYVKVTPLKKYTLYGKVATNMCISWSEEINKQTPKFSWD